MIKYNGNAPTERGNYLLRLSCDTQPAEDAGFVDDNHFRLGWFDGKGWEQFGYDWDVWEHSPELYEIEVLSKLDLEALAELLARAKASVPSATPTPPAQQVNSGAFRIVSLEEWNIAGGNQNPECDWHEGIGYVIYDDVARDEHRQKIAASYGKKEP